MAHPDATGWLAAHVVPLESLGPGAAGDDLERLRTSLAGARVIGVGEAVHGTRESVALRHRLLEFLVGELDVRVLAVDAPESGATALDEYVTHGSGDPGEALERLGAPEWNTHPMMGVLTWLRARNSETEPAARVRFVGLDPQRPTRSVLVLGRFLRRAAPEILEPAAGSLATLSQTRPGGPSLSIGDEKAVAGVLHRLDTDADALVAATSPERHAEAVIHAQYLRRAAELAAASRRSEGGSVEEVRARLRADAVERALAAGGSTRIAVWAHNEQIGAGSGMGAHLRRRFGDGYYALGTVFGSGSFQGVRRPWLPGRDPAPARRRLGAPPAGTVEAQLAAALPHDHVVDLHPADPPEGDAARWLREPTRVRSFGGEASGRGPRAVATPVVVGEEFDGLAYVHRVRPAALR